MSGDLFHLADRVIGRPLLLHPAKAEVILHVLQGRLPIDGAALAPLTPEANRFAGQVSGSRTFRIEGGVAIVSIVGALVNRGAWVGASSGLVSYEGIAKQISDAAADKSVRTILLDLDSPGGETGMFSLAAKVREVSALKPVVAVVNDMAASAAYGIASQAREIIVSPTSMVGSIGVVLTHLDRSGEMAKKGLAVTLIYAGKHKIDGHPFGPLSDAIKADLQAEVQKFYSQFVSLVAQGRGTKLTAAAARKTEARTYIGQDAIAAGLADRVGTFDAVLSELTRAQSRRSTSPQRSSRMDYSENDLAAARAEGEAAAYARINSILAIEGVTGPRVAHAIKLAALAPKMSAQEVADYVKGTVALSSPASLANRQQPDPLGSATNGPTPDADRVKQGWARAFGAAEDKDKLQVRT